MNDREHISELLNQGIQLAEEGSQTSEIFESDFGIRYAVKLILRFVGNATTVW